MTEDDPPAAPATHLSTRQAAFIGVGAMVGAGIFALLGSAGEVAGAAVWISFLIAGAVAGLQGYSFAKFGARYPSAGGLLEYVARGFGNGHTTGISAWLILAANAIVTGMVAVSFGSYASAIFTNDSAASAKVFAVLVLLVMTWLNVVGSQVVARVQSVVVVVVIGILVVFSVVTLFNIEPDLLAPSGYPPFSDIVSAVALTFFSFLGFGIVTFTAKDLARPRRELPRAIFLALGIATVIYVAISLGVFGTLTVDKVIASGATAIAEAAKPVLGQAGSQALLGLPRVRVKTPGGMLYGKIIGRDERSLTLITDGGARITVDAVDFEPAPPSRSVVVRGTVKPAAAPTDPP